MQKVIVTGGNGYIGSHTAIELLDQGFEPIVLDDLSNSVPQVQEALKTITGHQCTFEQVDTADPKAMDTALAKHQDAVGIIHFAAKKYVGESVEQPLMYYRTNLVSMMNVLEGMAKYGIPHLIFSSSCTVYGQPEQLPVTEQSPVVKAESPYGNTKQICEEIIADALRANSHASAIALRYFNPVGAHSSGKLGEVPLNIPQNLMPFVTQTAYGIREQLKVFGGDYPTPDGTAIRDYIHVQDLAAAHVAAMSRLIGKRQKAPLEFFNVGTGKGSSVLEVIQSFERTTGVKLNYEIVDRRPGDVIQIWADTTYVNQELGWKAKRTLDEMTASAWKWEQTFRKHWK